MPAHWRHTLAQTLVLAAAIILAYIWLHIPVLAQFSLQAFAACILLYFILKKINEARVWELLPTTHVDEMSLVTFAFLILIGATGGTTSVFFSLIFVYLFFVSMTMRRWTCIAVTLLTTLFFYALNPDLAQNLNLSHLASIPLVMVFFMFAKYQYDQARHKQTLIDIENNEIYSYKIFLQHKEQELEQAHGQTWDWLFFFENFIFGFIQPKLDQLVEMAQFPQNLEAIRGQLVLMHLEIEKLKVQIKQNQASEKNKKSAAANDTQAQPGQANQPNQPNQPSQPNQPKQPNQANQTGSAANTPAEKTNQSAHNNHDSHSP